MHVGVRIFDADKFGSLPGLRKVAKNGCRCSETRKPCSRNHLREQSQAKVELRDESLNGLGCYLLADSSATALRK